MLGTYTYIYHKINCLLPKQQLKKIETLAEIYILLDSLLFKIMPEKETTVLTIPETCVDRIIALYHSSLFMGHQGVIKHA